MAQFRCPGKAGGGGGSRRVAGEIVLLACLALLFLAWGLVRRIPNVPYRTRHAERVLYALVVLSYPAFVTNMLKYWDQDSALEDPP